MLLRVRWGNDFISTEKSFYIPFPRHGVVKRWGSKRKLSPLKMSFFVETRTRGNRDTGTRSFTSSMHRMGSGLP